MCLNVFLKRFLPFLLAAWCGSAAYYLVNQPAYVPPVIDEVQGRGTGFCLGRSPGSSSAPERRSPATASSETSKVSIISKPQAEYTDVARTNETQGNVRLKVTLLASGEVGSVTPVIRLPDGLTEQAIIAARQIKFEPKLVNGEPVSSVVTIDYSFSIY